MFARHVSDLTGPSSGAFYKLYLQIWYVVIRVLPDMSSRYEVVGVHIYYNMIHGPYNINPLNTVSHFRSSDAEVSMRRTLTF